MSEEPQEDAVESVEAENEAPQADEQNPYEKLIADSVAVIISCRVQGLDPHAVIDRALESIRD